ncbi:MAG: hypothetical protein C6W55_11820 [Thermobacillus sp.]|jgi:hypothetical protein|uniref:Uncharacterized protein n=2 Tax=Thermobacillus TaxID=76632 RepID=L0EEW9_THECK|nr:MULTISPECIES: hypothetical protein [Thermobacillus]AGA57695.1 hypothetical protein Theco_1557 [Thermobacillus composti KWC4]REJ20832.1 MAG: hypothetical protein C6W59_02185 [Paenibacillaceae bacterium]REK54520.1 MAG: hypothetical protein C6W55_11820 [Thermobacillus sp.]CAG5085080.1 Putative uncharacterized protein [Thermobacillus xylanilyticus]
MAERNVLAYFKSESEAEAALDRMAHLRISDRSIRRIDRYPGGGMHDIMNPINGDFPGLGFMVLGSDFTNSSAGILAAADVSASGLSTGGPDNRVTGRDVLLTVVVDEQDYEEAVRIAKEGGAMV